MDETFSSSDSSTSTTRSSKTSAQITTQWKWQDKSGDDCLMDMHVFFAWKRSGKSRRRFPDLSQRRVQLLTEFVVKLGGTSAENMNEADVIIVDSNINGTELRKLCAECSISHPFHQQSNDANQVDIGDTLLLTDQTRGSMNLFVTTDWLIETKKRKIVQSPSEYIPMCLKVFREKKPSIVKHNNDHSIPDKINTTHQFESSLDPLKQSHRKRKYSESIATDETKSSETKSMMISQSANTSKRQRKSDNGSHHQHDLSKLACQIENDGKSTILDKNEHLTSVLEKMKSIYSLLRVEWKPQAYSKVINALRLWNKHIDSERDIDDFVKHNKGRGVTNDFGAKLVEILETGTLQKLQIQLNKPHFQALSLFMNVFGVGPNTAEKWVRMGFKSLTEIKLTIYDTLSHRQKMGLKYYQDFLIKIPRKEIFQMEEYLSSLFCKNNNNNDNMIKDDSTSSTSTGKRDSSSTSPDVMEQSLILTICGSYRRGKPQSGDIDVLLTHPKLENSSEECLLILNRVLKTLKKNGFLIDDLSQPHPSGHGSDHSSASYMGVCKFGESGIARHIDIKVYPYDFYAFALLYFTGSDYFNRSMRLYAKRKGMTLSDHGLCPAVRVGGDKVYTGPSIPCHTERDIFEALGLRYIAPTLRNTYDHFGNTTTKSNDDSNSIPQIKTELGFNDGSRTP